MSKERRLKSILCLNDFEQSAKRILPRPIFGYVSGAAETNTSFNDNRLLFNEWRFVSRVLRDVSDRTLTVTLFGKRYDSPFGIAPMGLAALSAYRGDLALAGAAAKMSIASIMSGASLVPLELVAKECPGTWFQAYLPSDEAQIVALVDRVATAGFQTLVVTVDIPVSANRENNIRTGFTAPLRPSLRLAWDGVIRPRWLAGTFLKTLWRHGMPHFENSFAGRGAPILSDKAQRDFSARDQLSWGHLERIRSQWKGNLIVKGILSGKDAGRARDIGADGVLLSNHGGRQLDGAVSAMGVLEEVVDSLGTAYPVMLDGGFRRGSDVLKAFSLGAHMVFVGRPFNFAAAVAGEAGVLHGIELLRAEIDRNLAMLGVRNCSELTREFLKRR